MREDLPDDIGYWNRNLIWVSLTEATVQIYIYSVGLSSKCQRIAKVVSNTQLAALFRS
jgi:hypothetical protein